MLELGQPTHAFDADKLKGEIDVRLAREGEKFLALDGKTYTLTSRDLVIADQERVVGIGGVMGGEETGVTASTKNVLLEAAYFLPVERPPHRADSESAKRRELSLRAPRRSRNDSARVAARHRIDPRTRRRKSRRRKSPPPARFPRRRRMFRLRYERCNELIGVTVSEGTRRSNSRRIRFEESAAPTRTRASWRIPSYRSDLQREVDLIEEVVRVFGIEHVPVRDRSRFTPESEADRGLRFRIRLAAAPGRARTFRSADFEIDSAHSAGFRAKARRAAQSVERRSCRAPAEFLSGSAGCSRRATSRAGARAFAIFELGRVFFRRTPAKNAISAFFSGATRSAVGALAIRIERQLDYFDLKGVDRDGRHRRSVVPARRSDPIFALARNLGGSTSRSVSSGNSRRERTEAIGATASGLRCRVEYRAATAHAASARTFREIEKFPAITRDIAMIVPEKLTSRRNSWRRFEARTNRSWRASNCSMFSAEKKRQSFGAGKKSLAYALTYRDKTRTLTNDEVTVVHAKIRERLQRELGVELRE